VASPLSDWLIPVVVVCAVLLTTAVVVAIAFLVHRLRHRSKSPRPPLPRLEELDDMPADRSTKKSRRSFFQRDRYTRTPNRSQQPPEQVIYLSNNAFRNETRCAIEGVQ